MKRLFLNYRVDDTQPTVARLAEYLAGSLAPGQVFWDVHGIAGGEAWDKRLEHEVHRADVVFVVLGERWLTLAGEFGQRRIDEEMDWVRYEIEIALGRRRKAQCEVLPIFVDKTEMPPARALPKPIRALASVQGHKLRTADWEHDVGGLMRWLVQKGFPVREGAAVPAPERRVEPPSPPEARPGGRNRRWFLGGSLAVVASVIVFVVPLVVEYCSGRPDPAVATMASIPGGTFLMGSTEAESINLPDERPQHEVTIAPFLLWRTELTRAEYRAVMRAVVPVEWTEPDDGRLPANHVDFATAAQCCNALSAKEGLRAYYEIDGSSVLAVGGPGYRLPSEAEWEYACRGSTTTPYWSGDDQDDLARVAWYSETSGTRVHAVAEKPANPYGLHDMHGNVSEWCEDMWHGNYKGAPTDGSSWTSTVATHRVLRGGGFQSAARYSRSTHRDHDEPSLRNAKVGFRPARSVTGR
jgi:formylglycine-generating enzyme required for sulfatase activity